MLEKKKDENLYAALKAISEEFLGHIERLMQSYKQVGENNKTNILNTQGLTNNLEKPEKAFIKACAQCNGLVHHIEEEFQKEVRCQQENR